MNTINVGHIFPVIEKSGLRAPTPFLLQKKKQKQFLKICFILEISDNGQKPKVQYF